VPFQSGSCASQAVCTLLKDSCPLKTSCPKTIDEMGFDRLFGVATLRYSCRTTESRELCTCSPPLY
jgi:hypothetical protein